MNERVKAVIRGAVQGVGFRPFVYRLAHDLKLHGWVANSPVGVFLEVEGERAKLNQFLLRLETEKPPRAFLQSLDFSFLAPMGYRSFEIRPGTGRGEKSAFILPDIAPCAECLTEMSDPVNRRYLYPFLNCTNCGPRFSIIESLPYDRAHTVMKKFPLCPACLEEYENPLDRRFHAEPIACPECGPRLAFWDEAGEILSVNHFALLQAATALREGKIVALKGVGGFQLLVDARNDGAVGRLRDRKHREEKPFAVMFPSISQINAECLLNEFEQRLLASPEAPIVLLQKRAFAKQICVAVAPDNLNLGVMLPSSPLHHLLLRELNFPLVATSGNATNEPICLDELDALKRLRNMADFFLVHDRPIVRPVDDSIVRIVAGREMMLRRARGYAPLPLPSQNHLPAVLAVGAHLKNTVALANGTDVFLSQHIGDLETAEAMAAFKTTIADFENLYEFTPACIACDLHPEYLSTKYAQTLAAPMHPVQHHFAHAMACIEENELTGPALAVVWDGTGLGLDGTIWGGEFLMIEGDGAAFSRYAHFRNFPLPGGDSAIKQPCRIALGLLWEAFGDAIFARTDLAPLQQFSIAELKTFQTVLRRKLNSPITSSAGRLFDAVASLLNLKHRTTFEGQAAMALEFACEQDVQGSYNFELQEGKPIIIDWAPMLLELLEDLKKKKSLGVIAAKFHHTLVEILLAIARRSGQSQIVLSGGCFQNKFLLEQAISRLRQFGFKPFWHQRVPTNDGGIAFGQAIAAGRHLAKFNQQIKTFHPVASLAGQIS